jgi:hypothetical protein
MKSPVFSSEFIADRSLGGGTMSLPSAKFSHPPALERHPREVYATVSGEQIGAAPQP